MSNRRQRRFSILAAGAVLATPVAAVLLPPPLGTAVAVALALGAAVGVAAHAGRRTGRVAASVAVVALGSGLLLAEAPDAVAQWAIYAVAIFVAAEAVGLRVARLRLIAITDPLTGLLDRQGLWEAAGRAISTCRRTGRPLVLVHLDLDKFKRVNDSRGHAAGDRLLRECARGWTSVIAPEHVLARVGGDEFLLLLPGCDREEAERLLERLRFRSPAPWSHGIAELQPDDDFDRCLLRADAALYAAKEHGGPRSHPDLRRHDRGHSPRRAHLN